MTYDKDLEVLHSIRNKITLGIYHAEEAEAIDDAISAIKTLQDMGDTMQEVLRLHHIKGGEERNCTIVIEQHGKELIDTDIFKLNDYRVATAIANILCNVENVSHKGYQTTKENKHYE